MRGPRNLADVVKALSLTGPGCLRGGGAGGSGKRVFVNLFWDEVLNVAHPGADQFHVSHACFHACCSKF